MFSANTAQHIVHVPTITPSYEYLVVAGGGGGGGGGSFQTVTTAGGGGGAGGYLEGSLSNTGVVLNITVGAGGKGQFQIDNLSNPQTGGESAIKAGTSYLIRAFGGGWGAPGTTTNSWNNGGSGGSGGGAATSSTFARGTAGTGVTGQGFSGGVGPLLTSNRNDVGAGGGGGAGGAGSNGSVSEGGSAGSGKFSSIITGSSQYYALGGTGGYIFNWALGAAPQSFYGSGGSGGRYGTPSLTRTRGQDGTSGIVVIAYPKKYLAATATGTFTYSENSVNRVYTFTGPGTITF